MAEDIVGEGVDLGGGEGGGAQDRVDAMLEVSVRPCLRGTMSMGLTQSVAASTLSSYRMLTKRFGII